MNARDVMTTDVVSVASDTPVRDIALLLLRSGISAVPVIDDAGAPIGMVSEGDLIGRTAEDRQARRDWWLTLLAEGETLNADFLANMRASHVKARDVMTTPVLTVDENAPVQEIARILADHHIKRTPVLRNGRMIGIVSRADLVKALAAEHDEATMSASANRRAAAYFPPDRSKVTPAGADLGNEPATAGPAAETDAMSAGAFQHLVAGFKEEQVRQREESRLAAAAERRQRMQALLDQHISNDSWRALLSHAHEAAERGQTEFLLLRFPSQLCSDGGRSINVAEKGWPKSLRGEAAEIYLWWEQDLKPQGFHLTARVIDFPGGMPGDIGLFLTWSD